MSASAENNAPEPRPRLRLETSRRNWFWPIFLVLLVAGIAFGAYYLPSSGIMGSSNEASGALTYEVQRERLLISVTDDGNVESASNIDVKCEIAGGGTILWIVEDGKRVTQGEEIIRIDTSAIEDQLNAQKIVYEKALATKIETQEAFEAAKLAVQEYAEGTFLQTLQQMEATIKIAQQNLTTAQDMLGYSKRMSRKGYVTALQREADVYAVERAKLDLEVAETSKRVLTDFTKQKTIRELEAARDSAEARMRSEEAAFQLEKARLDRLEKQLVNCVITAPQNGMVVYANETDRRGSTETGIAEGTIVREGQTIVRIPDLAKMQVKVTIHESKIDRIRTGMPARIVIQDRTFQGKVTGIANQPEPTGWFSANVKEYGTIVSIDGTQEALRPGLTAFVEIQVADIRDALTVPVSAVVEQRGKYFCWVQTSLGPERRPLTLGQTNDKLIEVLDGVKIGDLVLRNPRAVVADARIVADEGPEPLAEEEASDEESASGQSSPSDKRPSGGPTAGGPPAGAPSGGSVRADPFQNDADKDGKLSRDEAPAPMKNFFDRIDKDGDGFITRAEMSASRAEREKSQSGAGAPPSGGPAGGPPRS